MWPNRLKANLLSASKSRKLSLCEETNITTSSLNNEKCKAGRPLLSKSRVLLLTKKIHRNFPTKDSRQTQRVNTIYNNKAKEWLKRSARTSYSINTCDNSLINMKWGRRKKWEPKVTYLKQKSYCLSEVSRGMIMWVSTTLNIYQTIKHILAEFECGECWVRGQQQHL